MFTLLKPILGEPTSGMTSFEWQWNGQLGEGQGFEIRVWREGETRAGAHDAIVDNQQGNVKALGNNTYQLNIDIRHAFGVKERNGEYLWTVVLVQISPKYEDLQIQAQPGRLHFKADGGGDGGGSSDNSNTIVE